MSETIRKNLLNTSIIMAIVNLILSIIIYTAIDYQSTKYIITLSWLSIFPLYYALYLNKRGAYNHAIYLFQITIFLIVFTSSAVFIGSKLGFQMYFLIFNIFTLVYTDYKYLKTIIVFLVLNTMAYIYVEFFQTYKFIPDSSMIYNDSVVITAKSIISLMCFGTLGYIVISFRKAIHHSVISLESAANLDLVTGISNRRHFMQRYYEEVGRAVRYKETFSILIADIDFFKSVNDRYGHLCGDFVLRETASLMYQALRESDLIARFGGEEFIILLPNTEIEGAEITAKKLISLIEGHGFHLDGTNQDIHITISIGISSVGYEKSPDDIIQTADQALYLAKSNGRNRFETLSPT